MIAVAPSILAADFSRLGEQVQEVEAAGANRIHVDVMDGHFVPNLSMGPMVVKSLRPKTKIPLEVHLMVEDPNRFIESFLKAGADTIIAHQEVLDDALPMIRDLRAQGKKVGLSINPNTPVGALEPYLAEIDLALCMTVYPGFGGQSFIRASIGRIEELHRLIQQYNPECELEVDGGIDRDTAPECVRAGANVLVAGSAIFGTSESPGVMVKQMASWVS